MDISVAVTLNRIMYLSNQSEQAKKAKESEDLEDAVQGEL